MLYSQDKILGMLWGLHAGDSLGAPLEFLEPSASWNAVVEITGGGKFRWKAGEATDDTDLMLCVLKSIQSSQKFSFDILKQEMLAWFASNPPDIGTTTIKGLRNLKNGLPLRQCGFVNNKFQGNGSVMRVAPLVLLDDAHVISIYQGRSEGSPLQEVLKTQTLMTHGHHYCVETDVVFIAALKEILNSSSKQRVYKKAYEKALQVSPVLAQRMENLLQLSWNDVATSGFCFDTLTASLWAFMTYNSFEDAVTAIVNRGDDSDSCGAVTGALCGAYYGTRDIPQRWLNKLEYKNEIQQLINAFFRQP